MNEQQLSRQEATDRQFIRDAAANGDKEAVGILKELQKLDQEYDSIYDSIETTQWIPRKSQNEHRAYYKFVIPRLKRLKAIPEERRRIIDWRYKLDDKKPLIYLQTLRRTKKENSLKNR